MSWDILIEHFLGAQIKKIREETNCQIELPKENTDSENIAIIGRKADAEKARKMILDIEKELVQILELEVKIENKLHPALIGALRYMPVKELQDKAVTIDFPNDGKSDVVTVRGKKGAVKAVKKALLDQAESLRLQSFRATVQAAPEFHRFLIGGNNRKEIRDRTGCRIAVPGISLRNSINTLGRHTDRFTGRLIHSNFLTETICDMYYLDWIFPSKTAFVTPQLLRSRILKLRIGLVFLLTSLRNFPEICQ